MRRKILGRLRKVGLVVAILVWSTGFLYSKGRIGVKGGIGLLPPLISLFASLFDSPCFFHQTLWGIERQEKSPPKEGVSIGFDFNNWQLELINTIGWTHRPFDWGVSVEPMFDFSPRLSLRFYTPTLEEGVEAGLSGGIFGGGWWGYGMGMWDSKREMHYDFYGGLHLQPTLKISLEPLIFTGKVKFWYLLWGERQHWYPYLTVTLSKALKREGRIYEVGLQGIVRSLKLGLMDYTFLWTDYILFVEIKF